MSRKKHRHGRKRAGHYCWVCDCYRPNGQFSGSGHRRHVCRDCARLGHAELTYRQAIRDLDCCLTGEGTIRRKHRKTFQRFLEHEDPRIRAYAEDVARTDAWERALLRDMSREYDDCPEPDNDVFGVWFESADDDQQLPYAEWADPIDPRDVPF